MAPPQDERAAAHNANDPLKTDRLAGAISLTDIPDTGVGQLIDKHGHVHSEAIFENRSTAAFRALGIRRPDRGMQHSISHAPPQNKSKSFMTASPAALNSSRA